MFAYLSSGERASRDRNRVYTHARARVTSRIRLDAEYSHGVCCENLLEQRRFSKDLSARLRICPWTVGNA